MTEIVMRSPSTNGNGVEHTTAITTDPLGEIVTPTQDHQLDENMLLPIGLLYQKAATTSEGSVNRQGRIMNLADTIANAPGASRVITAIDQRHRNPLNWQKGKENLPLEKRVTGAVEAVVNAREATVYSVDTHREAMRKLLDTISGNEGAEVVKALSKQK